MLDVSLVHLHEEVLDAVIIFHVMEADESYPSSRHKRRHVPLIEFVHQSQVHAGGGPHTFIYEVQCSMSNELVEVAVVLLLGLLIGGHKLHLKHWVVLMAHNGEVVVPRHCHVHSDQGHTGGN